MVKILDFTESSTSQDCDLSAFFTFCVLQSLMIEYTAYSFLQFVDLSTDPSIDFLVKRAEIMKICGCRWPDSRFGDDCILQHVAVFQVRWIGIHDQRETFIQAGSTYFPTFQVFITRFKDPGSNYTKLMDLCSCLQHSTTGFHFRHKCTVWVVFPNISFNSHRRSQVL